MATAADPVNFELLADGDIAALLEDSDAASTKKSIKFGYSRLESFARIKHVDLTDISVRDLDTLLTSFYASVHKEDGSLYVKKSMQYIRYGIQRHFLDKRNIDICNKTQFPESVRMFKAVLVKLKREGLGSTKHKDPISPADFEKIQSSEQTDCTKPQGLQNKVFIDILTFFCNRGRENVRDFKASDFTVCTDEDGIRYLKKRDQLTKNRGENDDEAGSGGFMYEIPGSDRCPVKSFEFYVSKLNPSCQWFWQKPKPTAPLSDNDPWYCNIPVGINTLAKKIKVISTAAKCSKVYTNHCLRATCVTTLDNAGFPSRDIISVSGHRSESSLKIYSKTSDERKKEMSSKIASKIHFGNTNTNSKASSCPSTSTTVPVDNAGDVDVQNQQVALQTVPTSPSRTRAPLTAVQQSVQPAQRQLAVSLSSESNTVCTTSHSHNFNFNNCVVHIHNS
ncbi:zinc finger MYM-type protein 4-like [Diadema setosum]|uniref:zinc finger MYM-type protein 4-like n=1 Tax=Diadema setosum TaxID=31175 RepID=UPI003B3B825F